MQTIDARQRTCSYCGGSPFPTHAAFGEHWNQCPRRIQLGYIPVPLSQVPGRVKALRAEAQALLKKADALLEEATRLETRLEQEKGPPV